MGKIAGAGFLALLGIGILTGVGNKYEPVRWRVGYGVMGVLCLLGAAGVAW